MREATKRLSALLLAIAMCLSLLSVNAWAAESESPEDSNTTVQSSDKPTTVSSDEKETAQDEKTKEDATGELEIQEAHNYGALYYSFDYETDELTIWGTGEMMQSDEGDYSWSDYNDDCTKVSIQSGVTTIQDYAFSDFESLREIKLPESLRTIGTRAFANCSKLEEISLPEKVEVIGNEAFNSCSNLKKVIIPSSVESIGEKAFYSCSNLAILTLSEGLTSIGKEAFCLCSSLRDVTIPNTVTTIGDGAFEVCSVLERIKLPSGLRKISNNLFSGDSNLSVLTLPNSLDTIGEYSFDDCENIKSLKLPSSLSEIGKYAFSGTGITKMIIPASVTVINESVFDYCPLNQLVFEGSPPTMWSYSLYVYIGMSNSRHVDIYYPEVFSDRWTQATRKSLEGDLTWFPYCHIENDEVITAHSMGQGIITKEPTYEQEGIKTYTCLQCGFTKTETVARLVQPVTELSKSEAEKLYAPVLDMLYYNIKTNWKYYSDNSSVSYIYPRYMTSKSDGKQFGYCFKDINSDGTPEMLIGIGGVKNNDVIYDLYTCVGGKVYHLASSGEKYSYYLMNDGTLMEESSSGGQSEFYDHFELKKNGKKLTFLEGVANTLEYNEYTDKSYRRIYHVTEDAKDEYGDWLESAKTDITKSEMNLIIDGWGTKTKFNSSLVVKYTPKSKTAVYEIVTGSLSKTSLKSAKAGTAGTISVTWKKNSKGKGYWVQCSTDKKFMKNVKTKAVKKNSTVKATIKGLKKGTWYVRVCTVKGNSFSAWSSVKTVKVK